MVANPLILLCRKMGSVGSRQILVTSFTKVSSVPGILGDPGWLPKLGQDSCRFLSGPLECYVCSLLFKLSLLSYCLLGSSGDALRRPSHTERQGVGARVNSQLALSWQQPPAVLDIHIYIYSPANTWTVTVWGTPRRTAQLNPLQFPTPHIVSK